MFQKNRENEEEEEKSFSDTYRSEILNNNNNEKEDISLFKKIIFTLLLVATISTISIFSYKYFNGNNNGNNYVSHQKSNIVQESDYTKPATIPKKEIIEEQKDEPIQDALPTESMMIDNIDDLIEAARVTKIEPLPTSSKNDINNIAEQMKLEIAKELDKKNSIPIEETKPIPLTSQKQKGEDIYMKELEDLSREIDGEIN